MLLYVFILRLGRSKISELIHVERQAFVSSGENRPKEGRPFLVTVKKIYTYSRTVTPYDIFKVNKKERLDIVSLLRHSVHRF
jgi:hypothetical protein